MSEIADSFKKFLLILLQDEEVGKAVRKCLKVEDNKPKSPFTEEDGFAKERGECQKNLDKCREPKKSTEKELIEERAKTKYLEELNNELESCKGQIKNIEYKIKQLEAEKKDLEDKNDKLNDQGCLNPQQKMILDNLREDEGLLSHFFKSTRLEGNEQVAMMQAVSVLSQVDNIRRLMEFYKNRCVERQSPMNENDSKLIEVALDWHNANWIDKPFVFEYPKANDPYSFDRHSRPTGMTGDVIEAVWVKGIPGLKIKPLVATR